MIDPMKCFPFRIEQMEESRFFATFPVPEDLPYFNGHFPGSPVLPAVAIVDACEVFMRIALKEPALRLKKVKLAKFMSPIVPGGTVRLEFSKQGAEWVGDWKNASSSELLASLRLEI